MDPVDVVGEAYRGPEQLSPPVLLHQRAVGPARAPSGTPAQSVAHTGGANRDTFSTRITQCESFHSQSARVCLAAVFLELHELVAEAAGVR